MALTFTAAHGAETIWVGDLPARAAGDTMLLLAHWENWANVGGIPAGFNWSSVQSYASGNGAYRLVQKTCANDSEAIGTWSGASSVICAVVKTDISGGVIAISAGASAHLFAANPGVSSAARTFSNPHSSSRALTFAMTKTAAASTDLDSYTPPGYTRIRGAFDATDVLWLAVSNALITEYEGWFFAASPTIDWVTGEAEIYDFDPNTSVEPAISATTKLQDAKSFSITTTGAGAIPGVNGRVLLSPTDNPADVAAVAQTATAWGDFSITVASASLPAGTLAGDTLYVFVRNDDLEENSVGYVVQVADPVMRVNELLRDTDSGAPLTESVEVVAISGMVGTRTVHHQATGASIVAGLLEVQDTAFSVDEMAAQYLVGIVSTGTRMGLLPATVVDRNDD